MNDYGIDKHFVSEILHRKEENSFNGCKSRLYDLCDDVITLENFKLLCFQEPSFLKILFKLKYTLRIMIFTDRELLNIKNKYTFYFAHPKLAETKGDPKNAIKTIKNNQLSNSAIFSPTPSPCVSSRNRTESLNTTNLLIEQDVNNDVDNNNNNNQIDIQQVNSNSYLNNNNIIEPDIIPAEPCLDCLYRHLIKYSSPPYSYDYGIENPQYKDLEETILTIKQLYGYSIRVTDQRQLGRAVKNYLRNI